MRDHPDAPVEYQALNGGAFLARNMQLEALWSVLDAGAGLLWVFLLPLIRLKRFVMYWI